MLNAFIKSHNQLIDSHVNQLNHFLKDHHISQICDDYVDAKRYK